jgi:hypothetical protein
VDLSKLKPGDYVIAGSAFVFLVSMFLPWFGVSGFSRNGTDYFITGFVPLLLVAGVVVLVVLNELTDTDLPDIPVPWAVAYMAGGGLAAFLILVRIVLGDDFGGGVLDDFSYDLGRKFGIFIAFLAAAGVAGGGFLKLLEDGGIDQLKGGGFGGFGSQGPPQGPPQAPPPQGPQPF